MILTVGKGERAERVVETLREGERQDSEEMEREREKENETERENVKQGRKERDIQIYRDIQKEIYRKKRVGGREIDRESDQLRKTQTHTYTYRER